MKIRLPIAALLVIGTIVPILTGCASPNKVTNIDAALTDGTHVAGLLLAVEDDWLVLDLSPEAKESQVALLDYGMIDTIRIIGEAKAEDRMYGTIIGGGAGILGGIFAAQGGSFDSTATAKTSAGHVLLGAVAGLIVGGALGYFIASTSRDSDIIVAQPEPEDYAIIRQYSVYPNALPPELQTAIDSDKVWQQGDNEGSQGK